MMIDGDNDDDQTGQSHYWYGIAIDIFNVYHGYYYYYCQFNAISFQKSKLNRFLLQIINNLNFFLPFN